MPNRITNLFKKVFWPGRSSTGAPLREEQAPPAGRPVPTAGPSRLPRDRPPAEVEAAEPQEFPTAPVEDVGSRRTPREWHLKQPEDPYGARRPPRSRDIDFSSIEPITPRESPTSRPIRQAKIEPLSPAEEETRLRLHREAMKERGGPQSFNPFRRRRPRDDPFDDEGGYPYGGGGPPRDGSGEKSTAELPEPSSGPNYQWYFLLMLVFYSGYQWCFEQYRIDFGKRLAEFEKQQNQKQKEHQPPNSKAGRIVAPQKATIANQLWDAMTRAGWLMGGLLAGGDLASRALNATVLPPLRRVAEAIVPPFIRSVLGPLMTALGKVALVVFSPLSRLALFFAMVAPIFGGSSTQSLAPLAEPAILWAQSLF